MFGVLVEMRSLQWKLFQNIVVLICILSGDGRWANGNWKVVVLVSAYFEGFRSYFSPSVRSKLGFQVSVKILHPDPLVRLV